MIVERILESVVLLIAVRTGMRLLAMPDGGTALWADLRRRPVPWAAVGLGAVLLVGLVVSVAWPHALATFARHPGSEGGWQLFTAPFVQEGVLGGVWNVVTGVIVLALAHWTWGPVKAAAIWLFAAWAPVGEAAHLAGYHVSHADAAAYSAGSSGATYFTAASVCAVLLLTGRGRTRLLGLVTPAVGLAIWVATNDGHGVLVVEGFVVGFVLAAAWRVLARGTTARFPVAGTDAVTATGRGVTEVPAL